MVSKQVEIINRLGLHARAAAKFVTTASQFSSEVSLRKNNQEVNGKSIMGVMMLAASRGTQLIMNVNGPDEEQAATTLEELIQQRFGEEE